MEQLGNLPEQQIMPPDLFEHYVKARTDIYASGKDPVSGLNIMGFKGYRFPEKPKADDLLMYEDNYIDYKDIPGIFAGFEVNKDIVSGKQSTFYSYVGGLNEEGLKLGEKVVYSKLTQFLKDHVSEVRFGKNVRFTIEDESGTWVYEGSGEVNPGGWKDRELIKRNDVALYELNGNGACFIKGIFKQ